MTIEDINNIANDIYVNRLLLRQYENEMNEIMSSHPRLEELRIATEQAQFDRDKLQSQLVENMKSQGLKSWKTEKANFARTTRFSASVNPAYKKAVIDALKKGEKIENWELTTSEYISVKLS